MGREGVALKFKINQVHRLHLIALFLCLPMKYIAEAKAEPLPCNIVGRMILARKTSLSDGLKTICNAGNYGSSAMMSYEKYCSRTPGEPCKGDPTGWRDVE